MDRLEIINHMLFTVGERVQVSLETQHPSVIQAKAILVSSDGDFQGRGWWFNKENSIILAEDDTGKIGIPTDTMNLEVISCPASQPGLIPNAAQYTVRGQQLYDTFNHTLVIGAPVTANIVVRQPIENMPHNAATYLKHLAALAMYVADDGDQQKMDRLEQRVSMAWHTLKAEELKVANVNALNSPSAAQLRYRIGQAGTPSNPMLPGGR